MALQAEPRLILPPERGDEEVMIERYVGPHPHERGRANAYLKDFGPSVAAVIAALRSYDGDIAMTAEAYRIPTEAVQAAVGFYRRNRDILDARFLLERDQWDTDFSPVPSHG